jgi:hypothetical protein
MGGKMRVDPFIALAAFAGLSLSAAIARAQVHLIDETRSVALNASVTLDDVPSDVTTTDTDPPTQSNTSPGLWTVNASGGETAVDNGLGYQVSANNTGSQTSQVTSFSLDDAAAVSISTFSGALSGNDSADSSYKVDFSVSTPTPLELTAQYSMNGASEGPFGTFSAYVTLAQSGAGNLFSLGVMNQQDAGDFPTSYGGGPTTFSTTLEPGNTYTLTADANIDRPIDDITDGGENVSVNFTASVPEPASLGIVALMGVVVLSRRRKPS